MPNYTQQQFQPQNSLCIGDEVFLFGSAANQGTTGETVVLDEASVAFALPPNPGGGPAYLSMSVIYPDSGATETPSATVDLQGQNECDVLGNQGSNYVDLGLTSTNKQYDLVQCTVNCGWIRAFMTAYSSGGGVVVKLRRNA